MKSKNLVVFAIDDKYVEPFCVAIASFADHHDLSKYEFGLVYSDISDENIEKIKLFFNALRADIAFKKIRDCFSDIEVGYHFNSVIFYRLLAPELFCDRDKLLYLDSDLLFLGNIDSLFDINPGLSVVAAVSRGDFGVPAHLEGLVSRYFPSGLLLIDVGKYIDNDVYGRVMKYLRFEKYEMPDQDALNYILKDWVEIGAEYGVDTAMLGPGFVAKHPDFKIKIENPIIIQFSGSSKPWEFVNRHPYKKMYWKYLKQTPFKKTFPSDLSISNVFRRYAPSAMKKFVKSLIGRRA